VTISHRIDRSSPFYELGPDELKNAKFELLVTMSGANDVNGSTVQVRYFHKFSAFDASASEWRRNGNGRRSDCWVKIPVETFPIKKRINTELFIDGEDIHKKRRDRIKKYRTSSKRVEYWREINTRE